MTTDPHQPPAGPPGGTGAPRQDGPATGQLPPTAAPGLKLFNAVRDLGIVRPDEGRLAAGVCAGLARRFGVDPLLVRGVFVVLSLIGGFGVGVYGLLWLLLPHPDGRIHAEGVLHGVVSAGFVGGLLLLLGDLAPDLARSWAPFRAGGWGPPRPFVAWALILLVVWLVITHGGRRRPQWPQPPSGGTPYPPYGGVPGSGAAGGPASGPSVPGGSFGQPGGTTPPAAPIYGTPPPSGPAHPALPAHPGASAGEPPYGPPWGGPAGTIGSPSYGATGTTTYPAAYAPTAIAPVPPPRLDLQAPSHPLTLAVLGLSLVGAATVVMWDHLIDPLPAHAGLVAVAVALGVVALGVVLAGLLGRRAGGLAPIAVLLAVVSILGAVGHGVDAPFRTTTWQPVSADVAESGYTLGAGEVTLNLTQPGLVTGRSDSNPVDIPVQLGVGRVRIVVPDATAVQIDASIGAGNIIDAVNGNETASSGGAGVKRVVHAHGDSPVIIVRANVGLGSLEIEPQGQVVTP